LPKRLLIIAHRPSSNTEAMAEAIYQGAISVIEEAAEVQLHSPCACDAEMVLRANALILFTTENFGYMSGALKDLFERIYYPCLEDEHRNQAKPFALVVKAGLDGTGAITSVQKIINGLRWREANPVLLCKGEFQHAFLDQCHELGQTMLASLEADII